MLHSHCVLASPGYHEKGVSAYTTVEPYRPNVVFWTTFGLFHNGIRFMCWTQKHGLSKAFMVTSLELYGSEGVNISIPGGLGN